MGQPRSDTRERIQQVALQLFTEQGYDKTSLREIAERLGVTKAALYYHFKSKDQILESLILDMDAAIQELLDWAEKLPPIPESRREVLGRLSELIGTKWRPLLGFMQSNQLHLQRFRGGDPSKSLDRIRRLFSLFRDPDATPVQTFKSTLAIVALLLGTLGGNLLFAQEPIEDLSAVALEVAFELVSS